MTAGSLKLALCVTKSTVASMIGRTHDSNVVLAAMHESKSCGPSKYHQVLASRTVGAHLAAMYVLFEHTASRFGHPVVMTGVARPV